MALTAKLVRIPSLAEIVADPAKAAALPKEAIADLRGELARVDTLLLCRLIDGKSQADSVAESDQLLNIAEASGRLGVSADYLYRHHKALPFTRHIGRKLLFSARGIERYISQRARP